MQGPKSDYQKGEDVAKTVWSPVMRSHRLSVKQLALLEPGLAETVTASLLGVMLETIEEVVRRGAPE